jgi:hypothetical protein
MRKVFNPITPPFDQISDEISDINGLQAILDTISPGVGTGTTFPTSPTQGDMFYRTDIKTLFQYESAWKAIISYGAVTYYVDDATGTDTVGNGYSVSSPVKTIQYAVNLVPPINGGNVLISVVQGTYKELVTIQGKFFSGPFTFTIEGEQSNQVSNVSVATSQLVNDLTTTYHQEVVVSGTPWTVDQFKNMWFEVTSGTGVGQKSPILDNTNNTLRLSRNLSPNLDATSVFRIFDIVTIIDASDDGVTPVRTSCLSIDCHNTTYRNLWCKGALGYSSNVVFGQQGYTRFTLEYVKVSGGQGHGVQASQGNIANMNYVIAVNNARAGFISSGAIRQAAAGCLFAYNSLQGVYIQKKGADLAGTLSSRCHQNGREGMAIYHGMVNAGGIWIFDGNYSNGTAVLVDKQGLADSFSTYAYRNQSLNYSVNTANGAVLT